MTPSWRKPAGVLLILALIITWSVAVASASGWVGKRPVWAQTLFYMVTGVIWITPMRPLLLWMETGRWR
jgi:hypothetical protein